MKKYLDSLKKRIADILFEKFGIICHRVSIDFNIESGDGGSLFEPTMVDISVKQGTDGAKISAAEIFLNDSFGCTVYIR